MRSLLCPKERLFYSTYPLAPKGTLNGQGDKRCAGWSVFMAWAAGKRGAAPQPQRALLQGRNKAIWGPRP